MEFNLSQHVKLIVDFEVGEKVRINGFDKKVDGVHTIQDIKPSLFSACQSGVKVMVSGYDDWLDLGWIEKVK